MAEVSIRFYCGCGRSFRAQEEAVKHVDESDHSLTVQGTVKPTRAVPVAVARLIKRNYSAPAHEPFISDAHFKQLRDRIRKNNAGG